MKLCILPRAAALALLLAVPSLGKNPDTNTLLYAPLAGIHQNQSHFEPVLLSEKIPESLSVYMGDARAGGSGSSAKLLFPLSSQQEESKRSNGWAVGASYSYQRDALRANDIFIPGFSVFEAAIGRSTSAPWIVAGTGLRGYMEISFRDQRPAKNARQQNRLSLVSQTIPNDNYFLAIKMGAATDNEGSGIVSQKPGVFSWAVQSAVYMPLQSKQGYANLKISPYLACFGKSFQCGMHFFYMNLFKGVKKPNSEFANHFAMTSAFLRYRGSRHLFADLEVFEAFASSPVVRRGRAVYSNRSTYSTYPGVKLHLVYGF